jgi:hypothetical protein
MKQTDNATLAAAMFQLSDIIESPDGIANLAIREAGERILSLDEIAKQRDAVYAEVAEWIKGAQEYFPGAKGLHDIYQGIEALEEKIAQLIAEINQHNATRIKECLA